LTPPRQSIEKARFDEAVFSSPSKITDGLVLRRTQSEARIGGRGRAEEKVLSARPRFVNAMEASWLRQRVPAYRLNRGDLLDFLQEEFGPQTPETFDIQVGILALASRL
jgi:hypothetical protein